MSTPRSWLEAYAPGPVVRRNADYSVPACNGQCVVVSSLSAAITITLPAAPVLGQIVVVKRSGAYDYGVTVAGNGHTIDGGASVTVNDDLGAAYLLWTGLGWGSIAGGSAGAGASGMSTTILVDKGGNDAAGARGGAAFLTLAAALAVAQSGDTVELGAGTWSESNAVPDAVASLVIRGQGVTTLLTSASGATLYRQSASALGSLELADLAVLNTNGAGSAIFLDGAAAAGYFDVGTGLRLRNVVAYTDGAQPAIYVACATTFSMAGTDGSIKLAEVKDAVLYACHGDKSLGWDVGETHPSGDYGTATLYACDCGDLLVTDVEYVVTHGCKASTITGTLTLNPAKGSHGRITFGGTCVGAVVLSGTPAEPVLIGVFDGAALEATLAVTKLSGDGRCVVTARNAAIAGAVSGDADTDLVLLGVRQQPTITVASGGTCDRDIVRIAASLTTGDNTIAIDPPFYSADYVIALQPAAAITAYFSTLNPASFHVQASGNDAGAVLVLHAVPEVFA